MPMHPAPPTELGELIETYTQTVNAVIDLGFTCRQEDFAKPSPCPGWSVQDVLAHVVGVESALAGEPVPEVEVPEADHIRNSIGRRMERDVIARRDRAGAGIVAELRDVVDRRLAMLYGATQQAPIEGPLMPQEDVDPTEAAAAVTARVDLEQELRLRIADIWAHEQDIRDALGRPGGLDTPAAATFVALLGGALPTALATAAGELGLGVGDGILVESTGPLTARFGVRLDEPGEGEEPNGPGGLVLREMFARDTEHSGTTGLIPKVALTRVALSTDALTRRMAGRRSVDETRASIDGNEALARRVLELLVVTP